MRDDFAKVLVERPRHGHHRNYGEVRNLKQFRDHEMFDGTGRESMKKRYDSYGDRKSFNEHLNPLKGWLRTCVGKNWDKCYSELRQKFDARSVINNHILEHLWDYVERNAFVGEDGKIYVLQHRGGYGTNNGRNIPVNQSYSEYYVCPKTGILKLTNRQSYRQQRRERELAAEREKAKKLVKVDDTLHLRLDDGVWFAYEVKKVPTCKIEYRKPLNYAPAAPQVFIVGPKQRRLTWDELDEQQRRRFGRVVVEGAGYDILLGKEIYIAARLDSGYQSRLKSSKPVIGQNVVSGAGIGLYYASKKTASHKELKAAGIEGTAAFNEDKKLSHREASKYR